MMNLTFHFGLPFEKPISFFILNFSSVKTKTYARDNTFQMLVMDQHLGQQSNVQERDPMGTETNNGENSNQCAQAGTLRNHFQEKSKKCNQCDFASSHGHHLKTHLKTHSGYKSKKCNQCDFDLLKQAISENIEKHTMDKSQTNVINVKMYLLKQAN